MNARRSRPERRRDLRTPRRCSSTGRGEEDGHSHVPTLRTGESPVRAMGLRLMPHFLHDGRAKTMEEAIRLHGGEATASRDRFNSLSDTEKAALLKFLKSL